MNIVKANWKSLPVNVSLLSGPLQGLVGIEECTDYTINPADSDEEVPNVPGQYVRLKPKKRKAKTKPQINQSPTAAKFTTDDETNLESFRIWEQLGIPEIFIKALSELNFKEPTQIQLLTLPPAILGRRDILGAAETGSGKTLAFGLPILTGILKLKEEDEYEVPRKKPKTVKPLYALILTPTRELAIQVKNHLIAVAKFVGINVAVVVGGMAAVKQERILSKGPEIVVATPGRLWELIQEGNPHLSQIDNIRFLAIDETDRMLEKGHFQELHQLLERLNTDNSKRTKRQNFVFSATLTLVHELPKHLLIKKKLDFRKRNKIAKIGSDQKLQKIIDTLGISNPKVVDITQKKGTANMLTECRITCTIDEKDYYIYYFLKMHPGRTLVFCNSIGCVKRLTTLLNLLQIKPLPLHASMQQRQRLKNLDRFRDTENGILIATDVAARGLDIPSVEHVIHYQTPRTSEGYIHRSGRTARATKPGITVLIIEPNEWQNYLKLCKTLGRDSDLPIFPVQFKLLQAVKHRVKLARDLDKYELQIKKANSASGWIQKAASDMDILIDDLPLKNELGDIHNRKRAAEVKRKELIELLKKPLVPKGFSGKYPSVSSDFNTELFLQGEQKFERAIDVMKTSLKNA